MKNIIFIIFVFLIFNSTIHSQWTRVFNDTATTGLIDIQFINPNTGWTVGQKYQNNNFYSRVYKTTDAGNTWILQNINYNAGVWGVFFLNPNTGWITGDYNFLMKTTNAGENWFTQTIDSIWANRIYFINENTGFISGDNTYRTTNSGNNWTKITSIYNQSFAIKFINSTTGFVGAYWNMIFKTTNAGNNWIQKYTYNQEQTYEIFFVDAVTGFASTHPVTKTTNGGDNWILLPSPPESYSLYFINSNTGWSSGTGIYKTTNSGNNWINQNVSLINSYKITNSTDTTLWAIGREYSGGAAIYKLNSTTSAITQLNSEVPSSFNLYQNYPNPFNPSTKIKFEIPSRLSFPNASIGNPNITLKIFDINGREIQTLVNESLSPGTYETTFDASNLSSGIYYYTLKSVDFTQTKKMIYLK